MEWSLSSESNRARTRNIRFLFLESTSAAVLRNVLGSGKNVWNVKEENWIRSRYRTPFDHCLCAPRAYATVQASWDGWQDVFAYLVCNSRSVHTSDLRQFIPAHPFHQKLVQRSGKGFVYRLPLLEYISSNYTRSTVPIWKSSKREGTSEANLGFFLSGVHHWGPTISMAFNINSSISSYVSLNSAPSKSQRFFSFFLFFFAEYQLY